MGGRWDATGAHWGCCSSASHLLLLLVALSLAAQGVDVALQVAAGGGESNRRRGSRWADFGGDDDSDHSSGDGEAHGAMEGETLADLLERFEGGAWNGRTEVVTSDAQNQALLAAHGIPFRFSTSSVEDMWELISILRLMQVPGGACPPFRWGPLVDGAGSSTAGGAMERSVLRRHYHSSMFTSDEELESEYGLERIHALRRAFMTPVAGGVGATDDPHRQPTPPAHQGYVSITVGLIDDDPPVSLSAPLCDVKLILSGWVTGNVLEDFIIHVDVDGAQERAQVWDAEMKRVRLQERQQQVYAERMNLKAEIRRLARREAERAQLEQKQEEQTVSQYRAFEVQQSARRAVRRATKERERVARQRQQQSFGEEQRCREAADALVTLRRTGVAAADRRVRRVEQLLRQCGQAELGTAPGLVDPRVVDDYRCRVFCNGTEAAAEWMGQSRHSTKELSMVQALAMFTHVAVYDAVLQSLRRDLRSDADHPAARSAGPGVPDDDPRQVAFTVATMGDWIAEATYNVTGLHVEAVADDLIARGGYALCSAICDVRQDVLAALKYSLGVLHFVDSAPDADVGPWHVTEAEDEAAASAAAEAKWTRGSLWIREAAQQGSESAMAFQATQLEHGILAARDPVMAADLLSLTVAHTPSYFLLQAVDPDAAHTPENMLRYAQMYNILHSWTAVDKPIPTPSLLAEIYREAEENAGDFADLEEAVTGGLLAAQIQLWGGVHTVGRDVAAAECLLLANLRLLGYLCDVEDGEDFSIFSMNGRGGGCDHHRKAFALAVREREARLQAARPLFFTCTPEDHQSFVQDKLDRHEALLATLVYLSYIQLVNNAGYAMAARYALLSVQLMDAAHAKAAERLTDLLDVLDSMRKKERGSPEESHAEGHFGTDSDTHTDENSDEAAWGAMEEFITLVFEEGTPWYISSVLRAVRERVREAAGSPGMDDEIFDGDGSHGLDMLLGVVELVESDAAERENLLSDAAQHSFVLQDSYVVLAAATLGSARQLAKGGHRSHLAKTEVYARRYLRSRGVACTTETSAGFIGSHRGDRRGLGRDPSNASIAELPWDACAPRVAFLLLSEAINQWDSDNTLENNTHSVLTVGSRSDAFLLAASMLLQGDVSLSNLLETPFLRNAGAEETSPLAPTRGETERSYAHRLLRFAVDNVSPLGPFLFLRAHFEAEESGGVPPTSRHKQFGQTEVEVMPVLRHIRQHVLEYHQFQPLLHVSDMHYLFDRSKWSWLEKTADFLWSGFLSLFTETPAEGMEKRLAQEVGSTSDGMGAAFAHHVAMSPTLRQYVLGALLLSYVFESGAPQGFSLLMLQASPSSGHGVHSLVPFTDHLARSVWLPSAQGALWSEHVVAQWNSQKPQLKQNGHYFSLDGAAPFLYADREDRVELFASALLYAAERTLPHSQRATTFFERVTPRQGRLRRRPWGKQAASPLPADELRIVRAFDYLSMCTGVFLHEAWVEGREPVRDPYDGMSFPVGDLRCATAIVDLVGRFGYSPFPTLSPEALEQRLLNITHTLANYLAHFYSFHGEQRPSMTRRFPRHTPPQSPEAEEGRSHSNPWENDDPKQLLSERSGAMVRGPEDRGIFTGTAQIPSTERFDAKEYRKQHDSHPTSPSKGRGGETRSRAYDMDDDDDMDDEDGSDWEKFIGHLGEKRLVEPWHHQFLRAWDGGLPIPNYGDGYYYNQRLHGVSGARNAVALLQWVNSIFRWITWAS